MSPTGDKPGLAVFDLDLTLWPFWVQAHECTDPTCVCGDVKPPFSKKDQDTVVDSKGKVVKPYPEADASLEYVHSLGIPMAVASRTPNATGANQLVQLFGWDKYFRWIEVYPKSKVNHFKKFQDEMGLPFERMIFFDDDMENIEQVGGVGVHCVHVPASVGVTLQLVKDGLQRFRN